jgi:glycosyltransferase involved in cell wall biosynthesis
LGANVEKVFIAPNAIDNDLFIEVSQRYLPLKEKLRDQIRLKGKIIILSVAQLIKRKGIEYLLHAYAKLEHEYDNLTLIVIGSGPLEYRLKDLSKFLGLRNVRFIPSGMKLDKLIKFYCLADIFVLPTLEDVWGFVINEAMACGLPVISTYASQAAIEMIRSGKNGYIIKASDSDQLYEALKSLIQNPILRREMSEKSRETVVQEASVSTMAEGFISAIKYCVKGVRK